MEELGGGDCTELSLGSANRTSHVLGVTNDNVRLVCGGYEEENSSHSCISLNTDAMKWEEHSELPDLREQGSMVFTEKGTYILGGIEKNITKTSLFLPLGANSWTKGPEIPGKGVEAACAVSINSTHLILTGGSHDRKQIRILDTATDTWTQLSDLPYGVDRHACIMTEEGVILSGGMYYNSYEDHGVLDKTLLIDPHTGQIETVGPMVTTRQLHQIVRVGGEVIVVGGRDQDGHGMTFTEKYKDKTWEKADYDLDWGRTSFSVIPMPQTGVCD